MVVATVERESRLQTDSSAFDDLPDAEPVVILPGETSVEEDKTPTDKICPTCDKPIYREPGTRGRLPRYHPECKPTGAARITGGSGRPKGRSTKAVAEADTAVTMLRGALVKLAMGVAMVDRYDGFCIMSGIPALCDNARGVLEEHDAFRRDVLRIKSGGSILGLVISGLMMVVPIAAHHGIIPSARISEMLVNLPVVMHKIAKRMKEGEAALTDMMERAANDMLSNPEGKPDKREESDHASGTD